MRFHTPLSPIIYAKLLGSKLAGEYQPKITATGMLKGDGNGGVSAAIAGTDYDTASSVVSATAAMTPEQAAQTRQNIGAGEPLTPEQIAEGAGAWLEDNLVTPSTPPIDSSLSVANAAADAKAVGDEINGINSFLGRTIIKSNSGTVNHNTIVLFENISLSVGDVVKFTLAQAIANNVFVYIRYQDDSNYTSQKIEAGDTEKTITLTDSLPNAKIAVFSNGNVEVTATVSPTVIPPTKFDEINKRIDLLSFPSNTVKTIGHRGDMIDAPQNTASAYIISRQRGVTIMENDLDITDDGDFVMWHDGYLHLLGNMVDVNGYEMYTDGADYYWYDSANGKLYTYTTDYVESSVDVGTLTRCNGDNYAVRNGYSYNDNPCTALSLSVLKRIDFGLYKNARFAGTHILTFEEWLVLCKKLGCGIYIDRKLNFTSETLASAANLVKVYGLGDVASWIGLSTSEITLLRTIIPGARVGILNNPTNERISAYAQYNTGRGFFFDGSENSLTKESVALGLSNGFEVECYYVGYSESNKSQVWSRIDELIGWGVTGITCDKYTVEEVETGLLFSY